MKNELSYDGWDLEHWQMLTMGEQSAALKAQQGFADDVARAARRYANQLQVRTHHYFLLQSMGVAPTLLRDSKGQFTGEREEPLPQNFSPYPQQLIDVLDSAEAALAVASADLEAYFSALDERRRQARKAGVDVAVQP